jgi:hypothetical protein
MRLLLIRCRPHVQYALYSTLYSLHTIPVTAVVAGFERLRHTKSTEVVVDDTGGVPFADFKALRWPYPSTHEVFQSRVDAAMAQEEVAQEEAGGRVVRGDGGAGSMVLVVLGNNREPWSFRLQQFLGGGSSGEGRGGSAGAVAGGSSGGSSGGGGGEGGEGAASVREYVRENFGAVLLLNTELGEGDASSLSSKWVKKYAPNSDGIPWLSVIRLGASGGEGGASREHLQHELLVSFCSAALEDGGEGYDASRVMGFLRGGALQKEHRAMGIPVPQSARWRE